MPALCRNIGSHQRIKYGLLGHWALMTLYQAGADPANDLEIRLELANDWSGRLVGKHWLLGYRMGHSHCSAGSTVVILGSIL